MSTRGFDKPQFVPASEKIEEGSSEALVEVLRVLMPLTDKERQRVLSAARVFCRVPE